MKNKLLMIMLAVFSANYLQAQTKEYTLKQCLEYALQNNQRIAISKYDEQAGEQDIVATRSQALPRVNGSANLTDNLIKPMMALPGELMGGEAGTIVPLEIGTTYATSISAEVTQAIFDKSVFDGLKAARSGRQYYKLSTQLTEEEVILQVSQVYYQMLVTQEQIKVQDANIEKLAKLTETTEGLFKTGLAKKIDLDRIKVNLSNARTRKTELENALITQTNQLKISLGMPVHEEVATPEIAFQGIEEQIAADLGADEVDINNRTEMKLISQQETLLSLQKKATMSGYYPKLSAFANYSYNGISNEFDLYKSGGTDFWYDMSSIGVSLQIPIFDGFYRKSQLAKNTIQIHQLSKQKESTVIGLNAAYENARLQRTNSLNSINIQKENLALAEEVYASSKQNFDLGIATLTDLLDAETSLVTAQNSYSQALLNYKLAELQLIKSTGNLKSLLN